MHMPSTEHVPPEHKHFPCTQSVSPRERRQPKILQVPPVSFSYSVGAGVGTGVGAGVGAAVGGGVVQEPSTAHRQWPSTHSALRDALQPKNEQVPPVSVSHKSADTPALNTMARAATARAKLMADKLRQLPRDPEQLMLRLALLGG